MRWIITALAAVVAASPCLAADRPKPVNTDHLQVQFLFESDRPGLRPIHRYDIRSGKAFSTLLSSKALPEIQLRVHSIDASPDGRVILIREEASKGLHPFRWILIYRSPVPTDLPKVRELFQVLRRPGETTELLIADNFPIHREAGGADPVFFGDLKLIDFKNDGLTFEEAKFTYRVRFEDCFENFPKPGA